MRSLCAIQSGNLTKEQATAMEEKFQKPSELVLAVIARLQEDGASETSQSESN